MNKVVDAPQIEASTMDDEPKLEERSGETIAIACCLPFGLKFTDIPSRTGGTKTIILPGVNSSLKGKGTGWAKPILKISGIESRILVGAGSCPSFSRVFPSELYIDKVVFYRDLRYPM